MKMNSWLFIIALLYFSTIEIDAQDRSGMRQGKFSGGKIFGKIVDNTNNKPLQYARITIFSAQDSTQVNGALSNKDGNFEVTKMRPGKFFAEVKYIGFDMAIVDDITIGRGSLEVDLGMIKVRESAILKEAVEVLAERKAIEYNIDKKVINVSKIYTGASGTAVDVLENVPSVTVDIEGNVALRGSTGFEVLIDGRPSILDANDALKQMPASLIQDIEIITNPSVKFDPDGTTGIINIITKKADISGTSGLFNGNIGFTTEEYGGDALLNYKNSTYNVFLGFDYNKRTFPGDSEKRSWQRRNDTTYYLNSTGEGNMKRDGFGIRGGIDLYLSKDDNLSFQGRYGDGQFGFSNDLDYEEWINNETDRNYYTDSDLWERKGDYYSLTSDYSHKFDNNGHKLIAQVNYRVRNGEELATNNLLDEDGNIAFSSRNTEDGPSKRIRYKIDYTLPVNEKDKFEAGVQGRRGQSEDITAQYLYDIQTGEYIEQSDYANGIEYDRNIYSMYSLYAGELGKFGYQGGLRGEYTYRDIKVIDSDESFNIDRWDYFPTAHVSYKFDQDNQLMASYTKRIDRPRGWYLEPFISWTDAYNVRRGNPDLLPEYIDSYELGYQHYFGRNSLSFEGFYRKTHNKIERIITLYEGYDNVYFNTFDNVGTDFAAGLETMLMTDILPFWNLNLTGSIFQYKVDSEKYGIISEKESFNWNARASNTLVFNKTRIQFSLRYRSGSVTAQGTEEGVFTMDAAVRQEFLDNNLSFTLQARDLLGTAKREGTVEGENFYSYNYSERVSPMVTLTLSYNFNNYEKQRKIGNGESNDGNEDF